MDSLLKNLKKHVTCSICLDTFTDPKTIACFHTFCCECLKQYASKTQRDGQFRCPECQTQVDIPERNDFEKLPTGFLQTRLLELLAVQQSEISCDNCREKSAEPSCCFNCGTFLCPDCVNAHEVLRNVAFEGHQVTPVKQFQTEDYETLLKRHSFCPQRYHEREVTRFFCLECQICVCQICIVTDHGSHALEPLDRAADGEKAKLMAEAELLKQKSKTCSDMMREFVQTANNLGTNIANAKREVSQTAKQMIAKIQQREREIITALENTREARMKTLNSSKAQLQSLARQIDRALEFANNLIQRSSSSNIMQSHKDFEQRCKVLNETPVPALPVSSSVKFVKTCVPKNLKLGFVAFIEASVKGLNQDFRDGVEADLIICPNLSRKTQQKFDVKVVVEPAENVQNLITCKKKDGNFLVKFTPKAPGAYNIVMTIHEDNLHTCCFPAQVKEQRVQVVPIVGEMDLKEREGNRNPHGIAVNSKGLIAVSDCKSHCILVFDEDGNYLGKHRCKGANAGELDYPTGITFVNDNEVFVADFLNHRIQHLNLQTETFVKTFGKKGTGIGELQNPVSLCMDDKGRVAVADCVNNRIQVFKTDGAPVFSFGSGKLDHPTGCIFHQNMFIVSDTYNDCLKVFDCSGNLLRKIGKRGEGDGELIHPQGLCIEKCGHHYNILVCDSGNGRIVQFSLEGSFIGQTVTKLQDPIAVAITPDNRVLVSDLEARKIYILQINSKM